VTAGPAARQDEGASEPMVVMARIVAPFGVNGWIKVQPFTQAPDGLLGFEDWWLGRENAWHRREVDQAAVHGQAVVAKLRECEDREAAARLRGLEIAVPRSVLPESGDGEYYWADLQGMRVKNVQGEDFGRVARLLETGANDVLVVQGDRERLIPFVAGIVAGVDIARGEIVVDWGADF